MLAADIYDSINRLVGKPVAVRAGAYTRTDEQFQRHTLPLLEEISGYAAPDARVLIIGCGTGVEIEWFAKRCGSVVAVDVNPGRVEKAAAGSAHLSNVVCKLVDGSTVPFGNGEFDLIFMHNVCEHILNLEQCFSEYHRVLKPGKVLINVFAPLFYSPYGGHLQDALKLPWGHLIFGVRAVVNVRNRYYPGQAYATSWNDMGLNRLTERRYRKIVRAAGFRDRFYQIQVSKGLPVVASIPFVRNLFIVGVKNILLK